MAQHFGHVLNSAFLDALEHDIESLVSINNLVGIIANEAPYGPTDNRKQIDLLNINPSFEIDELAADYISELPPAVRRLFGNGNKSQGASFASYLLFEKNFCKALIAKGYEDGLAQQDMIARFWPSHSH